MEAGTDRKMTQLDLIEYAEAAARRDAGMAIAQANCPDYFNLALLQIESLRSQQALGEDFTFEDIILALTPLLGAPPSKAVPGSLAMTSIKRGWIEATGQHRKAKSLLKNAHKNAVYRWSFEAQ
jgi:hypothetical protein